MKPHFSIIAIVPLALALLSANASAATFDKRAKDLAKMLKPAGLTTKHDPNDLAAAAGQMKKILEVLEKSYRSQGPPPESLLQKAFEYQPAVKQQEAIFCTVTLKKAWEDARSMGLFDEKSGITPRISQGRDQGMTAVFEYIVPMELAPKFSRHYGNVRIVIPSRKRQSNAELTAREKAFQQQMQSVELEIANEKKLAQTRKNNARELALIGGTAKGTSVEEKEQQRQSRLWESEMAEAGESAKELPNIKLQARMMGTPSNQNNYRWRIEISLTNFSRHPTEIDLVSHVIGITDEKRDHYIMLKKSDKLKLLEGQSIKHTIYTKSRNAYKAAADKHDGLTKEQAKKSRVRYHGFVIEAIHAKGTAGSTASNQGIAGYLNGDTGELDALPKF